MPVPFGTSTFCPQVPENVTHAQPPNTPGSQHKCHTQKRKLLHEARATTNCSNAWNTVNKPCGPMLADPPLGRGDPGVLREASGFAPDPARLQELDGGWKDAGDLQRRSVPRLPRGAPKLAGMVRVFSCCLQVSITSVTLSYKNN